MRILVTGGAGYIGSHMVHTLLRGEHQVVVVDDLSSGRRAALHKDAIFIQGDVRDRALVTKALVDHHIQAVFHFASRIQVGESVIDPHLYYRDNLSAGIELVESALEAKVRHFIMSSTAAVYGNPLRVPLDEEHPTSPVNPYGETKLAMEWMLASYAKAYDFRYAALRYFNAAGADPEAGLGECHEPETHLIPLVIEAALGKRPHITIYGEDYDTPDGTCLRDYVHVRDLAEAHLAGLEYLAKGGASGAFNLGTGIAHSVREVIEVTKKVSKREIPVKIGDRRAGDPAELVASPARAERLLGWKAKRGSLEEIVSDAWRWHSRAAAQSL